MFSSQMNFIQFYLCNNPITEQLLLFVRGASVAAAAAVAFPLHNASIWNDTLLKKN